MRNSHGRDLSGIVNDILASVENDLERAEVEEQRPVWELFRIAGKLWKWLGPQ